MALRNLAKLVLILNFLGTAMGNLNEPCASNLDVLSEHESASVHNLSPCATSLEMINGETVATPSLTRVHRNFHKMAKRSTITDLRSDSVAALQESAKLLKIATMLPAETLEVLRKVTVPLLNTTLAVPANLLESVAAMSVGQKAEETKEQANLPGELAKKSSDTDAHGLKVEARSLNGGLSNLLPLLKLKAHKDFFLHKKLTLGPFSLTKIVEFGKSKGEATTPSPGVAPGTTYPPEAVVVTSTPPPLVAETTAPATPGAKKVCSVTPAVASPSSVVVVTSPEQPIVDSTNQVVIVQDSPPTPKTSE